MEHMYDIVAEVDKYTEFVPWCTKSEIYNRRPGFLNCRLAVGFPPIEERYNSAVTLHKPDLVRVRLFTLSGLLLKVLNGKLFFLFLIKTYVMGIQKNCLIETVLLSTQNKY